MALTDGSSALKYEPEENSGSGNVINLDEYRQKRNSVETKVEDLTNKTVSKFDGNQKLKDEIRSTLISTIREDEIKTSGETIDGIAATIIDNLGVGDVSEAKVTAKEIYLEIENWRKSHINEVVDYRKKEFEKNFEESLKKENPDIKQESLEMAKEYSKLVSGLYFDENETDEFKDEALIANREFGPGKLESATTDLKGTMNLMKRTADEIKDIREKYKSLKNRLDKIKMPNLRQVRSFENVMSGLDGQNINSFIRVGGQIKGAFVKIGQNFQVVQQFTVNSIRTISQQGFKKGFQSIMQGILKGGVKAGAAAGKAAAAGATAAQVAGGVASGAAKAIPVVGWVAAIASAIKKTKEIADKIAESLGISFKKDLEASLGKEGAKVVEFITPILLGVILLLFLTQMFNGNMVSSLVPPKEKTDEVSTETGTEIITGDINVPQVPTNFTRQDLVNVAMSLYKKVYYEYGGTWECKGACPNWGSKKTIPTSRVDSSGKTHYYYYDGVDCSGFVRWVYYQLTGQVIGGGSWEMKALADSGQWSYVNEGDLKPGDVAWRPGHVAMFIKKENGTSMFLEAFRQTSVDYVSNTGISGSRTANFDYYLRPNVTFSGD